MNAVRPELLLLVLAIGVLVYDLFLPEDDKRLLLFLALGGLCIVATVAGQQLVVAPNTGDEPAWLASMVASDGLTRGLKLLLCLSGILVLLTAPRYIARKLKGGLGEFVSLTLFLLLATMIMVSARNLISIYLGIEFTSLTSYMLAGFRKRDSKSAEAGMKYFMVGAASSGLMLYGMSLLYGVSAAYFLRQPLGAGVAAREVFGASFSLLGLNELGMALGGVAGSAHALAMVALLFVLAGVGFKIAIVPFHMWCPDVYEGAPTPVTALFSVAPKIAGFGLLLRLLHIAFPALTADWSMLLAVLAAVTMTAGNLEAIAQTNLKRMLAYSSISHAGFLLMVLAVPREALGTDAWMQNAAIFLHLLAYVLMNVGAFAVVMYLAEAFGSEELDDMRQVGRASPLAGVAFVVFGLSLAGVPPTLGFITKYLLLSVAIRSGLYWLAGVAILNTAISIYYYFNVVRLMFFEPASPGPALDAAGAVVTTARLAMPRSLGVVIVVAGAATLLFGLYPQPLLDCARSFVGQ